MNMKGTRKFIRRTSTGWIFFSLVVTALLVVACGDTTATGPGAANNTNTSRAMMGQTPGTGSMMNQTPGSMMGGNYTGTTASPLSVNDAKEAATVYLNGLENKELAIDEIMIFDNNAYVAIKDGKTGIGAFELLVNPLNKTVFPEFGPNMMWNVVYGYMSGQGTTSMMGQQMSQMMGNGTNGMMGQGTSGMMGSLSLPNSEVSSIQPGKMPVTADQALKITQVYLDKVNPGVQAAAKADEYPGYYTVDVQKQGKLSGMLSVNGFTGQVWYHTWHGQFIEMTDFGK